MTELDAWTTNGTQVIAKISAIAGSVMAINITHISHYKFGSLIFLSPLKL
jgi:hypothetical protein